LPLAAVLQEHESKFTQELRQCAGHFNLRSFE
jgi:hypothetical protein